MVWVDWRLKSMDRDFRCAGNPHLRLSLFSKVSFLFHLTVEAC